MIVIHEMTDTGNDRPSPWTPCVVISPCPCDDDPDDESDNDNDDGTQPSAHHQRDIIAYQTSLRRRHTSINWCVDITSLKQSTLSQ